MTMLTNFSTDYLEATYVFIIVNTGETNDIYTDNMAL